VNEENPAVHSGLIFRVVLCAFLGSCLYLFIRNNHLFAHGARNLRHPEALVMFAVLGIPFILSVVHLVRILRHQSSARG
jgi:DMSO reductase anchor subunit